jgi:hypothetical protein
MPLIFFMLWDIHQLFTNQTSLVQNQHMITSITQMIPLLDLLLHQCGTHVLTLQQWEHFFHDIAIHLVTRVLL